MTRAWIAFARLALSDAQPPALPALLTAGWRRLHEARDLIVLGGGDRSPPVTPLGASGLLLGRHTSPSGPGQAPALETARRLVGDGWGGYLALWREPGGVSALRDPSGSFDAVGWRLGGWIVLTSGHAAPPSALLPPQAGIDWPAVGRILAHPGAAADIVPLIGVTSLIPGVLHGWTDREETRRPLWSPAQAARRPPPGRPGDALRDTVDGVVTELLRPHDRVVGLLSGGLDSAIVAGSVARVAPGAVAEWLNYVDGSPGGDERPWAEAMAAHAGLPLALRPKAPRALGWRDADALAAPLRPALQALDADHDADVAGRMRALGASAVIGGQGGDAVLLRGVDTDLARDRVLRLGPAAFAPRFLAGVADATRRSVWAVVRAALAPARPLPADGHPWLGGLDGLPPAKRSQVRQLANCLVFHGPCRRAAAGETLHPLLTQPVLELCLSIPTDILAPDGRERGLARRAFADRLPDVIRARTGKGDLSRHYGQVVLRSLPFLRELLIDGRLVGAGLLDPDALRRTLTPEHQIQSPGYNAVLIAMALELWVRRWSDRLGARRHVAVEPVQGPRV